MRFRLLLGAAAVLAVAAVLATSDSEDGDIEATSLHVFGAFSGDEVASDIEVDELLRGAECVASHISVRLEAWRCSRGSVYWDPCFSARSVRPYVVCPEAPWSDRVTVVRLARRLSVRTEKEVPDPTRFGPWGILTATGERCRLIASGTINVAGMRVSYACESGAHLVGEPRRRSRLWTIFFWPDTDTSRLSEVEIASAWW